MDQISGLVYRTPRGTEALAYGREKLDLGVRLVLAMTIVETSFPSLHTRCERAGINESHIEKAHEAGLIRIVYERDALLVASPKVPLSAQRARSFAMESSRRYLREILVRMTAIALLGEVARRALGRIDAAGSFQELDAAARDVRAFEPLTIDGLELVTLLNELETMLRPWVG
jgi:hypothetical protein